MDETTTCPSCGASNVGDARFCGTCGAAQAVPCPRCGRRNPPGAGFCNECGGPLQGLAQEPGYGSRETYTPANLASKIREGSSAMEGERKQITVLFADVVGYTTLSERIDPEEMRAIMRRAFDVMLAAVHQFEGTVAQLLGDGMLALFGAPIAHEDHAARAIRAGLAMQDEIGAYSEALSGGGVDFRIRVGIHSGLVVFGAIGTDLEFTFQAVGDTVNTASRVQGLAPPGAVVVSDSTYRLAEGYFVFEDLGLHEVKNKADPIHVFEALRATSSRSRVDVLAERGLGPFIGRAEDLRLLEDAYREAEEGRGRVVFISGEAGLGKSRLVHELRAILDNEDLLWLTGRCISYGAGIPYVPIVDLTKAACGVDEADSEAEIDAKLTARVAEAGGDPVHLPYLRFLLSIDPGAPGVLEEDPMMRKPRVFEAFRDILLAATRSQPTVLVIEDLHWIDPQSTELLSFIAEQVPDHRLLVLLTHRPDWVSPFGERAFYSRIDLAPLSELETGLVARSASGERALPADLERLIYRKAEGNPFFTEEVTKSLLEGGDLLVGESGYELRRPVDEITVPDTVQDVIMARLDRLDEAPRHALQIASVIGREFTSRLLQRTSPGEMSTDDSLRQLKSVQLIFERSLYPELVFMFKHALTHEVAYGSLLLERRRALHGAVGDALRELFADRPAEVVETVAYHLERAERWEEAVGYLAASAEKSLQGFALPEAQGYCERALGAIGRSGGAGADAALIAHLYEILGQCHELKNEWAEAIASYRSMVSTAEGAGDRETQGRGLAFISMAQIYAHELREGAETAREAERIAEEIDDPNLRAFSLTAKAVNLMIVGALTEGYAAMEEVEESSRASTDPYIKIIGLDIVGEMRHMRGEDIKSMSLIEEASAVAEVAQLGQPLSFVSFDLGLVTLALGRYDEAFATVRRAIALADRLGDQGFWWCRAKNTLGRIYMELQDLDLGALHNHEAVERALVFGDKETLRNAQLNLADCALGREDPSEALRQLEDVERACAEDDDPGEWMKWRYTQHLWIGLSEVSLALGDEHKALDEAERCLVAAERTETKRYVSKARRARARAFLALGRLDEAAADAAVSLAVARDMESPELIWQAHALRAALFDAEGRAADGRNAYAEALSIVDSIAGSLFEPGASQTLLSSPVVQKLRSGAGAR